MRTPAQIKGHPIHPMLVTIPIGLWIFSFVCDLVAMGSSHPETWTTSAFYAMVGGILGALAAALPGLVDLLSLTDKGIRKTALKHMGLNLTVVAIYVFNAWLRATGDLSHGTGTVVSFVALAILVVSGWLGGKMVYEAGVGVHTEELGAPDAWRTPAQRDAQANRMGRAKPGRAMASDKPGRETDRPL